MARPKPIKDADLLKIIAIALGHRGEVIPSRHFREQAALRNFDIQDAINVLEGAKGAKPKWNKKSQNWNYDILGRDIGGEELTIRIAPTDDETGIVLVTGF